MAEKKKAMAPEAAGKALDDFLQLQTDARSVHQVERRVELHVSSTNAYIPSYTRQEMDAAHGAPIQAVYTRTDKANKKVYIYAADNPQDKQAKRLRSDETMGPAYFAFGVPLRTLQIKLPANRRIVLPLNSMEVPNQGTVWWASFADLENELRNVDKSPAAAAKKAAAAANQES